MDAADAPREAHEPLSSETVDAAARIMQAMASPVRLRILDRLRHSPCSVGELVSAVAMEQAAVSNHLRVLRHLDLVTGRREGRHVIYALHDAHVVVLLEQALDHVAHLAGEERTAPRTAQPEGVVARASKG